MKLEIIVRGATASGKTTVSALIERALKDHGIDCHVNDQDGEFCMNHARVDLMGRAAALAEKKLEVIVNQEQVIRSKA